MDIDYRLYLQELNRIQQDYEEEQWSYTTDMIDLDYPDTDCLSVTDTTILYDDEF